MFRPISRNVQGCSFGVRMKSQIPPENVQVESIKHVTYFEFAKMGRFGPT